MNRWWVRIGILVVILAAIWILKITVFKPDPVSVRVQTVSPGRVESTVTNSRAGTVKARHRAKLSPEVGGQIVALPFREGERVRKGDAVLRLESSAQKAQLELIERQLDAARAERERACLAADRARREFDRVRRLAEDKIVSVDLLDNAESAWATSRAACKASEAQESSAEASVDVAKVALGKTVLRAPFDGIVADLSVEVGEWTTPSPPVMPVPPVIDILDPSSIFISAPMDEVDSALIRAGLPTRVTVDSHRGEEYAGFVTRVAPYVLDLQEQNRTVEVEVELVDDEFAATLLPGTSADLEVVLEARTDVLRIPTGALMEGSKALVLVGDTLEERQIAVGIRNWNFTEVLSGLNEGDEIVVSLDSPDIEAGARVSATVVEPDEDAPGLEAARQIPPTGPSSADPGAADGESGNADEREN
jgi:HlyD family secretion protein